jgi:Outer membrane protein beta-barrel domain
VVKPFALGAALAVLPLTAVAGAQAGARYIGLDAGVLRATLVGSDVTGAGSRTTAFGGGVLVFEPAGFGFGLLTGLYYAPRGAHVVSDSLATTVRLSYLEVPLLARYQLPLRVRGTQIGSALLAGLTFGITRSCSLKSGAMNTTASSGCTTTPAGPRLTVGKFDAGFSGGVEFMVPISPSVVIVPSVRYTRGLIDLGAGSARGFRSTKNAALQLGVGVRRPR